MCILSVVLVTDEMPESTVVGGEVNINNLSPAASAFSCYSPAFVLCFDLLVTPYTHSFFSSF
jgi:hypothetical protein